MLFLYALVDCLNSVGFLVYNLRQYLQQDPIDGMLNKCKLQNGKKSS